MKRRSQLALELKERPTWGGRRKNAGRKPMNASARTRPPHRARAAHDKANAVHVTLRVVHGIGSLRRKPPFRLIKQAFAEGKLREDFRLVHFAVEKFS
jgi:hypothetical protein